MPDPLPPPPRLLRDFATRPPAPRGGAWPPLPPPGPEPPPSFWEAVFDAIGGVARGATIGSEGAGDNPWAQGAELLTAGLPVVGGFKSLKAFAGRGLYSRVDEALKLLPAKGAHPNKVLSLLKSNASAEELAYRGVPEFLAAKGNATVTPAELAAHLAAHPAPLPKVVTRGASTDPAHVHAARDFLEHGATRDEAMTGLQEAYRTSSREELRNALDAAIDPTYPAGPTKFGSYQLPGGEAYRETLVTLPPQPKPNQAALEADIQAGQARLQELYQQAEGLSRRGPDALKPVWAEIEDLQTHHRDLMRELSVDPPGQFRSGHFDEPNILVHTRANERTLPTGERGRFVEEVQSDWHQQGKEQGYRPSAPDSPPQLQATQRDGYWEVNTDQGDFVTNVYGSDAATPEAAVAEAQRRLSQQPMRTATDPRVPDAPFKESWPDLGLKQQLLETAADPEAQWLGFTSGGTQAARYDLSKQISSVEYNATAKVLSAYDPQSTRVINETVSPEKLADYIGKEAAQKLLGTTPHTTARGSVIHRLEGQELQVGGEGMHHFYDQVLPKRLAKILKPFGGTVERGTVDPQAAAAWIARLTPEMKARLLKEGLPLLAIPGGVALSQMGRPPSEPSR